MIKIKRLLLITAGFCELLNGLYLITRYYSTPMQWLSCQDENGDERLCIRESVYYLGYSYRKIEDTTLTYYLADRGKCRSKGALIINRV